MGPNRCSQVEPGAASMKAGEPNQVQLSPRNYSLEIIQGPFSRANKDRMAHLLGKRHGGLRDRPGQGCLGRQGEAVD